MAAPKDTTPTQMVEIRDTLMRLTTKLNALGSTLTRSPTESFGISDLDTSSSPKYFGYLNKTGAWYIMKLTATGATYAAGEMDYLTNWTNRTSLTYSTYDDVF